MKWLQQIGIAITVLLTLGCAVAEAAERVEYNDAAKTTIARIWTYDEKTGYLSGLSKAFDDAGRLKEETMYDKGMKNGIEKRYYESGVLSDQSMYKDNRLDGTSESYSPQGELFSKAEYQKGTIVKNTLYGRDTIRVIEFHGTVWSETVLDRRSGKKLSHTIEVHDGRDDDDLGSGFAGDVLTVFPMPAWPKVTVTEPITGKTTIEFFLNQTGHVSYAYIQESSGNIFLDEAALTAAESYTSTETSRQGEVTYIFHPNQTVTLDYAVLWFQ